MKDEKKSKKQLLNELAKLRNRIADLEASEAERKQGEAALQKSNEQFQYMIDNSRDIIIQIDLKGNCTFGNKAAERITGYPFEKLLKMNLRELIAPEYQEFVFERLKKRIAGEPVNQPFKFEIVHQEGYRVSVELTTTGVYRDGKLIAVQGIARDIAERKRAEEKLRGEKERTEQYLDIAEIGLAVMSADENITLINRKCCDVLRYKEEELIGKNWFNLLVPLRVREEVRGVFRQLMAGDIGPVEYYENPLLTKDGEERSIAFHNTVIRDPNDQIVGTLFSAEDITERKRMEETLRESEEFNFALFQYNPIATIVVDREGQVIKSNIAKRETGDRLPNIGDVMYKNYAEEYEVDMHAELMECIRSGKTKTFPELKYGDTFLSITIASFPKGAIITSQDITERKRTEEAIRESEEKFRTLFNNLPIACFTFDREGNVQVWNKTFEELYSLKPREIVTNSFLKNLTYPEDRQKRKETIEAVFDGKSFNAIEWKQKQADGSPCFVYASTYPLRNASGKVTMGICACVNITERKQAEEALRESEEKYRNLIDQSRDAIYLLYEGKFELINKRFEELFGYTQEETNAPDFDFMNLVAPTSKGLIEERVKKIEKGESVPPQYEFTVLSRDGKEIEVETSVSYIQYKGKIASQGILRDITERRRLQEQLIQSEKMSALGQLISGVAHELNNPMTGVLGFSQLLLALPDLSEKAKQTIEKINREAERARKIIGNLLTFARQRSPEKRRIQINEVVERILELRAYELKVSNIEVIRKLDPNVPSLLADEHQLQQVFMNIIINAEQVMLEAHGKGKLKVTTQWDAEQNMVRISFRDDGPGIAKEHLSKIFDPFFSTKPVGKGTGLGLSLSYSIVQEHSGNITVASKKDRGTTFTVELPFVEAQSSETVVISPQPQEVVDIEKKKILVIDDEAAVVDLVREALEQKGHAVEITYNGESALQKIRENNFDAVVSDCKMPGKSGFEIYLYCKEKEPDLAKRFLFLTGDVVAPDSLHFMERNKVPHLSKPFDLKDLTLSVSHLFEPVPGHYVS